MLTNVYCNCPSELKLEGVRVERSQAAVTDLNATWKLKSLAGVEIGSGSLLKINSDDPEFRSGLADYRGVVSITIAKLLTEGVTYILELSDGTNLAITSHVTAVRYEGRAT